MNQWPPAQSNGMFPQGTQGHLNPASMYNNLGGGANQLDFSQFTHGLQNGGSGSPTPAFSNQNFNPASVVPAKRTHDGMSGSPVQNQQGSRSQTPNYGGAFQQSGGQQFPNVPTPYSHLQQSNSNNATPSPTMSNQQYRQPQQQQQQQRMQNATPFAQQQGNYGNQMSPGSAQGVNQPTSMPQQNQMGGLSQQYGMSTNASMPSMSNSMQGQTNQMQMMNAQKAYQLKLKQHQQQLRNSGMIPPQAANSQQNRMFNPQQQMANGQAAGQMNMSAQQQMQKEKRNQFLKALHNHAQGQGRPFNPTPQIGGRPVDLFALFHLTNQLGGSAMVDRNQQWQSIAAKMGFNQAQYPTAADELRGLFMSNMAQYERMYTAMQTQQAQAARQEKARRQAHEMAGFGAPQQGSPTRPSQTPSQQNQYAQLQQGQQGQMPPESTPVQANAQLPQNGMITPQQQMLQHRRASSVRRPEGMTPQAGQALATQSPHSSEKAPQRSPSIKQEQSRAIVKNEEPLSTEYVPARKTIEWYGGYDLGPGTLRGLGKDIAEHRPLHPTIDEMGVIDVKAISLSLASGIHSEVRYALDTLAELTQPFSRIVFDIRKCEDLTDIIIDCAEEQVEMLSEEAAEVSDALDLASYEDIMRAGKLEAETLQEVPEFGSQAYDLDRAADRLIAITTILRNLSFFEVNHACLTSSSLIKWLSNTIRLLGTRNMLLRTFFNTLDFYKDMVIFLSNITQSLELPSRDDALHILHFLLAFAPQPAPSYPPSSSSEDNTTSSKLRFMPYIPNIHVYLPPAVDSLAKLLARQDPNRMFYKSIFTASSSSLAISESPLDLLTRAFALSISVLPDRSKPGGRGNNTKQNMAIVEARKASVKQGILAADILTTLAPGNDTDMARHWIESEDGWAVGLLRLTFSLSIKQDPNLAREKRGVGEPLGPHYVENNELAQRALGLIKRLAERAGRGRHHVASANGALMNGGREVAGEDEEGMGGWDGTPQGHTILGALMLPNTDEVALGLLCGLHDMAMQG